MHVRHAKTFCRREPRIFVQLSMLCRMVSAVAGCEIGLVSYVGQSFARIGLEELLGSNEAARGQQDVTLSAR